MNSVNVYRSMIGVVLILFLIGVFSPANGYIMDVDIPLNISVTLNATSSLERISIGNSHIYPLLQPSTVKTYPILVSYRINTSESNVTIIDNTSINGNYSLDDLKYILKSKEYQDWLRDVINVSTSKNAGDIKRYVREQNEDFTASFTSYWSKQYEPKQKDLDSMKDQIRFKDQVIEQKQNEVNTLRLNNTYLQLKNEELESSSKISFGVIALMFILIGFVILGRESSILDTAKQSGFKFK